MFRLFGFKKKDEAGKVATLNSLELTHYHWQQDNAIAEARRNHDRNYVLMDAANEAAVKTGEGTIRWAILINGGTAAGLLTFLASLDTHRAVVANSLVYFAAGVLAGAFALGAGFVANYYSGRLFGSRRLKLELPYVLEGDETGKFRFRRNLFQGTSISLFIISMICFVLGILDVRATLSHLPDKAFQNKPPAYSKPHDRPGA